jgi:outer membrane scaffolding protein for murein synthesis (MipA/OmpV family)
MKKTVTIGFIFALCCNSIAKAGSFSDFLEAIDLNEYALGPYVYHSESYYDGVDDFTGIFPLPSTFDHAILNEFAFYVRDGDFGLRKTYENGWQFGGVAKIQTLGYGTGESSTLDGMSRRDWTIQVGANVGRQFGPVRLDLMGQTDVLGEHDGQEYTFKLALPFVGRNWQLIPQFDALYQSDELINHYFGVTEQEARPGRPEYLPGGGTTLSASLHFSWRFHPKWYLTGSAQMDFLPDVIQDSPLVSRDRVGRLIVGVAYDAPLFVAAHDEMDPLDLASFDLGLGAFYVQSESNVDLLGSGSARDVDLEDELGLNAGTWAGFIDAVWRLRLYHRLELSLFELSRDATTDLDSPLEIGDIIFDAGDIVTTEFSTQIIRLAYGFSLIQDDQKELSLIGGVHITDVEYRNSSDNQVVDASTTAILPVVGVHLRVNPTNSWQALVRLEYYELDLSQHGGRMIDFSVAGQYQFTNNFAAGAGYSWYRQDINSKDPDFTGDFQFDYRGPVLYLRARF